MLISPGKAFSSVTMTGREDDDVEDPNAVIDRPPTNTTHLDCIDTRTSNAKQRDQRSTASGTRLISRPPQVLRGRASGVRLILSVCVAARRSLLVEV